MFKKPNAIFNIPGITTEFDIGVSGFWNVETIVRPTVWGVCGTIKEELLGFCWAV